MQKIIFDCDNTVGIEGYPMDDALAFLYLLGNRGRAQVLAFCCTFGNGTAQQVYESSRQLLEETGLSGEIPLYPGAGQGENPCGESARKIVELAHRYPGEVSFLGIGSLTNLYAVVDKKVTVDEVNAAMKAYAETIPDTFAYNEDQIVSRDIVGETHGSIFDATQTMCSDLGNGQTLVQVTSWYDNENSYTSQMVRTIKYFEKFVA